MTRSVPLLPEMITDVSAPPPDGRAAARLMLLDTYGLVYAAFFAMKDRPLTTTRGTRIEAAYVFTTTLTKLIADEKPTHVVACFDRGLPAARIAVYEPYKAQRQTMPDDLRSQFALVRQILAAYDIPTLEIEGEEADDIIATLACEAEEGGNETVVVTGDNDLLQVVDERTTVLVRTRMGGVNRYDPAAVRTRYDLEPKQLADYRGLKGDPSDNLPGIPGVGEKTAVKLIKAAGSLDALLGDPARAGSAKLEALVREHAEVARRCRDVSLIKRDLDVSVPWDAACYTPPPPEKLYVLYRDLEFKSLLAKLPVAENDLVALAADDTELLRGTYRSFVPSTDPPEFVLLGTMLRGAASTPRVAVVWRGEDEIGIATAPESAFAFAPAALEQAPVRDEFDAFLQSGPQLVVHDWKGLRAHLGALGFAAPSDRALTEDTMIAAHLLNPSRTYANLDDAAGEYLAKRLPLDAAAHADAVLRLGAVLRDHLAHRNQTALYDDIELPLARVLARMEKSGIAVDPHALDELAREVDAAIARLQERIYELAGETFNIGSPQQLGAVLFERLALPSGGRTKTGWATGSEVLLPLSREHEIVAAVLEYREVTKLKNTYIEVIPRLVGGDGRLRTIFNQTATATGRLSSTNPNLQNIPIRTDLGRRIRRAFVAPGEDRRLLAADYSQIELRIMAHLSGDAAMREAFRRGDDIHDVTARGIFFVPPGIAVTPNQRRIAKSVNFGLLYGMSDFGLAQRLEIERPEARAMTDAYFARFPDVRGWIERNLEFGREHGYVETLFGRRRYMPDLRSRNYALRAAAEREATNAPMQGSAADLMKLAMVRIDAVLAREHRDAAMLLQIHDELIFEVAAPDAVAVAALVKREMEHAAVLDVPLEVTLKIGCSWYDVEPLDAESAEADSHDDGSVEADSSDMSSAGVESDGA
ncbi:MAG: DNA polymerase I [Candidatus Eremiobacteraeota bacterium]|nr:DNA polymerase I [Candidatus Eremiobacteraeota bacterium]